MTRKMMQINMITRDRNITGDLLHLLEMIAINLLLIFRQSKCSCIIDAFNVGTGHCQKDTFDHDITHILCFQESRFHAGPHLLIVSDFTLPDSSRPGFPQA